MNPWPFIIAAYALTIAGTLGLSLWSWLAMRRAEASAEKSQAPMKAKHQRLTLVVVALVALLGSGLLAASALRDQAAYFYAPADLARANVEPGKAIRLGGMVADGSIQRAPDGLTVNFIVTDGKAQVPVSYRGIVPDLFKENSGVVAEGRLTPAGAFVADNILAKHDERYMPPQLEGMKHKSESLEE